jgi:competence protein ComGC
MKIITFVLIIILILILILPNKKSNNEKSAKSGCGCKTNIESYANTNRYNISAEGPPDPIQYIIADSTQIDWFSVKHTGKNYGWEFSALPTNATSSAKYKPKSSLDTVDHLYGALSMKKYDSNNKLMYDAKGNSVLEDPTNNIITKIMKNIQDGKIQQYTKQDVTKPTNTQSNIKLYDSQSKTYLYADTTNSDINKLMIALELFKIEVYKNYITQVVS